MLMTGSDKKLVLKFHPDKMSAEGNEDQAKNEAQFVCIKKGWSRPSARLVHNPIVFKY